MSTIQQRGQWSSRLGFVLAASGSAVGLGNIWRFPYVTGQNGGAAFVLIYILCVVLICVPYLFAEIALGRKTERNPVGAIHAITPQSAWILVGALGVLIGFAILSYYAVIAGWALGYVFKTLVGSSQGFGDFIADPVQVIPLLVAFIILTGTVVYAGVEKGIERWSKVLMPLLFILILVVIVRGLTLPGAGAGVRYYLMPDFSKVGPMTFLNAMGQAFFSLSLGMGILITYGSYLRKKDDAVQAGLNVAGVDTLVALLGGLMIFPALFAMGQEPGAGPALIFVVLPEIFKTMPLGTVVGVVFFLLLSIAALTSTISLLEVAVSYLVDEKKFSRKYAVLLGGGICFLLAVPSALSFGGAGVFSNISLFGKTGFLEIMDFIWGNILLTSGALLFCLFIGWVWGVRHAAAELMEGAPYFEKLAGIWSIFVRFLCPVVIFVVLLNIFKVFGE